MPDNVLFEDGAGETVRRRLLQDFIKCYNPDNRHDRLETERFRAFCYEDLVKRDKASLDIFWLKDESLEDSDNLPDALLPT